MCKAYWLDFAAGRLENAEPTHTHTHTHTHNTLYTALLLPAPTAQGRAGTPYSTLLEVEPVHYTQLSYCRRPQPKVVPVRHTLHCRAGTATEISREGGREGGGGGAAAEVLRGPSERVSLTFLKPLKSLIVKIS